MFNTSFPNWDTLQKYETKQLFLFVKLFNPNHGGEVGVTMLAIFDFQRTKVQWLATVAHDLSRSGPPWKPRYTSIIRVSTVS